MIAQLMMYGLTQMEAEKFVSLVQMMEIPDEDIQAYEEELDSDDPFPGGPSDCEVLVALKQAVEFNMMVDGGEEMDEEIPSDLGGEAPYLLDEEAIMNQMLREEAEPFGDDYGVGGHSVL